MAQQATTYKLQLELSDTDRGIYQSLRMTLARHPSETEERLAVRMLAFGLWYQEALAFGRGLSEVDEPALWCKSPDDQILHWIEVGRPTAERLIWCARRYPKVSLLAYGSNRVWAGNVLPQIASLGNLNVAQLPQEPLNQLAVDLPRSINWGLMITDDVLYVSDALRQVELPIDWLQGTRN